MASDLRPWDGAIWDDDAAVAVADGRGRPGMTRASDAVQAGVDSLRSDVRTLRHGSFRGRIRRGKFVPQNPNRRRRVDSQSNRTTPDGEHFDRDLIANLNFLVEFSSENEHVGTPLSVRQ